MKLKITYLLSSIILAVASFMPSHQAAAYATQTSDSLTSQAQSLPIRVPVLVLAYYPPSAANAAYLDPSETGISNYLIADMQAKVQETVTSAQAIITDGTRYHGYKNPNAPAYLTYYTYDQLEYFAPMPTGVYLGSGAYRPNYNLILSDLNICDYVDAHGVKEVWIYGYHSQTIAPDESKLSSKYGDVSNAAPKDESLPSYYRLPRCDNAYTMYNFNYMTGVANNLHNRLHQIENLIFFAEDLGYPLNNNSVTQSLFWNDFSVYGNRDQLAGYRASCGNTHRSPNTTEEYKYDSRQYAANNCETWHPDDSKTTYTTANCEQWGCTDVGFYTWYMQNLPGYNNGIVYQGKQMRNWWEAVYDFDAFIDEGWSLYTAPLSSCQVNYSISYDWGAGFNSEISIKNTGEPINGWHLTWSFPGNQHIVTPWNGEVTQAGQNVSITNLSYNSSIPTNGSTTVGFQADYLGANAIPTNFALNGVPCSTSSTGTSNDSSTPHPGLCKVIYKVTGDWGNTFNADVTLTNLSTTSWDGWQADWNFSGNQTITNVWNGSSAQGTQDVSVNNVTWNHTVAPGASVTFGFSGSYSGTNTAPASFSVNGAPCQ